MSRRGFGVTARFFAPLLIVCALAVEPFWSTQRITWFRFNTDFIQSHFATDSAIGNVRATTWSPASSPADVGCGGSDGELHVGSFEAGLDVPPAEHPISAPLTHDDEWGIVFELPNAGDGDGPARLDEIKGLPAVFHGFFRVWNEGHDVGRVFLANPHHVLEIHPAWKFTSGAVTFDAPELVATIPGYRASGVTRLRPMLGLLQDGKWPRAYRKGNDLVVSLIEADTFFQFPAIVRERELITGGHAWTIDIFSNSTYQGPVAAGIRAITITGSPIDASLQVGEQTTLQGFFSVNVRVALEHARNATDEANAVHVPEALEFFVFGRTTQEAVVNCR